MIGNLSFLYLAAIAFGSVNAADHGAQQKIMGLPANNPVKQPWIWPLPQKWERGNATLKLSNNLHFNYHGHSDILQSAVKRYENLIYLKDDYPMIPYNWSTTNEHIQSSLSSIDIDIQNSSEELDMDTDESYNLTISTSGQATIKAPTVYGALHAIETFSQIVRWNPDKKSHLVPNVPWSISDYPKYKHRGILFDTARHYYTPKDIYKVIDSKFN